MLKITKVKDSMTPALKQITKELENLPMETYRFWKSITPIKTGNARRKTNLFGRQFRADYDYAVPLDKGRSKQAPRGLDKPTWQWFKQKVKRIFGA